MPLPLEMLAGKVVVAGYGEEWGAIGVPPTDENRMSIPQSVFDALQGALTGGDDARLIITSTPGGTTGPLYRAVTAVTKGSDAWKVTRLSAEDSTNVSPEWVAERAREDLTADLSAITYSFDERGRIRLEGRTKCGSA